MKTKTGYNTEELIEKAIKIADQNNCIFVRDLVACMGISSDTFYLHKLNEVPEIKDKIESNRFKTKNGLRKRWYETPHPTTDIALYKLLANSDELGRLSTHKIEATNTNVNIDNEMSIAEIEEMLLKIKKMNE